MTAVCPTPDAAAGALRAMVATVDCQARGYAEAGYAALTGTGSFLPGAVTALLVILVALTGYRLLFGIGGTRLSDGPLLALRIGTVLALTLQWPLFERLVFDVAYRAPVGIAAAALGRRADPLAVAQADYDALTGAAAALEAAPVDQADPAAAGKARATADLAGAARLLFLATAGMLSAALAVTAILVTFGPVFIALLLLGVTRGLFLGWLRALIAAALAPMLIWANMALMTAVMARDLDRVVTGIAVRRVDPGAIDAVVTTIRIFAGAQTVLIGLGLVVAVGLRLHGMRAGTTGRRTMRIAAGSPSSASPSRVERLADAMRLPSMLRDAGVTDRLRVSTAVAVPSSRLRIDTVPDRIGGGGTLHRQGRFSDRRAAMRGRP